MNTLTMETPEKSIFDALKEYWAYGAAFGGFIFSAWAYLKLVRGKWAAFREWCRKAANAPAMVEEIKAELLFEGGVSVRQKLAMIGQDLQLMSAHILTGVLARRAMMETLDVAMFEADASGRFLWVNNAFLELVDREFSQVIDFNWRNAIHDLDRDITVEQWRSSVVDCSDYSGRFRVRSDEGNTWVKMEATCLKDSLGHVLQYVGKLVPTADPKLLSHVQGHA